jgi:hypothetical protein
VHERAEKRQVLQLLRCLPRQLGASHLTPAAGAGGGCPVAALHPAVRDCAGPDAHWHVILRAGVQLRLCVHGARRLLPRWCFLMHFDALV